jgi:hypothetical protein
VGVVPGSNWGAGYPGICTSSTCGQLDYSKGEGGVPGFISGTCVICVAIDGGVAGTDASLAVDAAATDASPTVDAAAADANPAADAGANEEQTSSDASSSGGCAVARDGGLRVIAAWACAAAFSLLLIGRRKRSR